ncbi:MAG: leucyl aminopeptidase [Bacteroidales bacterium]|nr:leucyl aminopeptidase [Bacteroidales bacterium]
MTPLKIVQAERPEEGLSTIYLLEGKEDIATLGLKPKERSFSESQLSGEKRVAMLNRLDYRLYLVLLDDRGSDVHKKEKLREAAYMLVKLFRDYHETDLQVADRLKNGSFVLAFLEGLALSAYRFDKYLTGKNEKKDYVGPENIILISEQLSEDDLSELAGVICAVRYARDLVNEPVSWLNAVRLSEAFQRMGKKAGFRVEVFHKQKIESLRMGGLLAVNRGSIDPPTFTIMEWKPEHAVNKKPVVLVGKGVVFDTGGLSLKPTKDSMDTMKSDMAGAAAVGAAIYALARNKIPCHVIGLVPATDNRPDGNAYAPGDVITMYDGTTVEVLNTDAEGRMILADALAYAKQYAPELVIELSTLTGAAAIAIGKYGIVGMGTAPEEEFSVLVKSGEEVHERVVRFPFWEEYKALLKSDIADLKNIGGREAGAITAGKFLEHFTDYPYIHLDIAGPAFVREENSWQGKGATGTGVRLLYDFIKSKCRL